MRRFDEEIYAVVQQIPTGAVATYGGIARLAGYPAHARLAGLALARAPEGIPCHRVVTSDGRTVPGWSAQRRLLEAEGVTFRPGGRIDLARCRWSAERETRPAQ